jgi:uncharacterized membrane protein
LAWFNFFNPPQNFFSDEERAAIVAAIRHAEKRTSGEVRVYIESRCRFVDPLDRAKEIFYKLKMERTDDRNAVLFYIALKDRQMALFADQGIFQKCGAAYWNNEVKLILGQFSQEKIADGIVLGVQHVGEALHQHFPYENDDKNELPDDIVFGK